MASKALISNGPAGAVTTRELSRNTGRLLDEIRATGKTLLVVRHGRPVASVTPVQPGEVVTLEPPSQEVPDVKLDPLQQRVLAVFSDGRMEIDGLLRR